MSCESNDNGGFCTGCGYCRDPYEDAIEQELLRQMQEDTKMTGEIDKDFYCTAGHDLDDIGEHGCPNEEEGCFASGCCNLHRKWPTPEQFKEEYGVEYPDDAAVYCTFEDSGGNWLILKYREAKHSQLHTKTRLFIICACTPWDKPPDDFMPEVKE